MGPPEALVLALQKQLGIDEFIETGTYHGGTAAWAGRQFARVATIELSPKYHAAAVAKFQSQPHIRALCGGSVAVLGEVIPALSAPALFWLDAHWSGFDTAGQEAECPVLEEIALLNASPRDHVVLVDDARLFCAPPPRPHRADQWPDLATVTNALVAGGRRHVVMTDDVFVAVPAAAKDFLTNWLQDAPPRQTPPPPSLLRRVLNRLRA
jgi:hypothetical protein